VKAELGGAPTTRAGTHETGAATRRTRPLAPAAAKTVLGICGDLPFRKRDG